MAFQPILSLYHYDGCGFCMRVRRAIAELGVEVELRDITLDRAHMAALIQATGRRTVPVLRIEYPDGRVEWLPESAEIVRRLREMTADR